jgi:signal transduction histidine kinase
VASRRRSERSALAVEAAPEPASVVCARRMDAAARTAGALAHEIANYLGTIRGTLYLVGEKLGDVPGTREDLDALARTLDGAAAFVEALRRFAHPPPLGAGPADLNAVLREAEPALRAAMRPGTSLQLDLAAGPLTVRGDATSVRELAQQLVAGASHTLGAGGHVEIETRRAPGGAGGRPAALLVVRDDGPGLDRERAERIFEPFVFDRAYDGGLRLPTAYATVTASGGAMAADSEPGKGTTILVTLPLDAPAGGLRTQAG